MQDQDLREQKTVEANILLLKLAGYAFAGIIGLGVIAPVIPEGIKTEMKKATNTDMDQVHQTLSGAIFPFASMAHKAHDECRKNPTQTIEIGGLTYTFPRIGCQL